MNCHFFGGKVCVGAVSIGVALTAVVAKSINAEAVTFYVDSVAGHDTNSGTSPGAPWQTVGRVMNELPSLGPGDAVLFKGRDVWTQQFDVNRAAGSAGHPIVFASYSSGRPVLENSAGTSTALMQSVRLPGT